MEKSENVFEYTYCSARQDEVQRIRQKYLPEEKSKLEQLRRLDESTTKKGLAYSLVLGIAGCLALGIGMCCIMKWDSRLFVPGVVIGCVGIVGMVLAYPLNLGITQKARERLAPEILKLTDELMNGQA